MFLRQIIIGLLLLLINTSCNEDNNKKVNDAGKMKKELDKLNELLRDSSFAITMAQYQDSVYQASENSTTGMMPSPDSIILQRYKDEKVATNIAGFLATECGIGALMEQEGGTPIYWLKKIVNNKLDTAGILLLNRFANATWKASQPYRGLQRISKDNFIAANFLSDAEIKKDYDQVLAASVKLLDTLEQAPDTSAMAQLEMISMLMKNRQYLTEIAKQQEAAYYKGVGEPVPDFTSAAQDTLLVEKSAYEAYVATNIASFYALECGLSYLAIAKNKLPSDVLQSITDGSIAKEDKRLLERFANATWKAGQAFRNMERIERPNFTPFGLLSNEEIAKDWLLIKAAAVNLQQHL